MHQERIAMANHRVQTKRQKTNEHKPTANIQIKRKQSQFPIRHKKIAKMHQERIAMANHRVQTKRQKTNEHKPTANIQIKRKQSQFPIRHKKKIKIDPFSSTYSMRCFKPSAKKQTSTNQPQIFKSSENKASFQSGTKRKLRSIPFHRHTL